MQAPRDYFAPEDVDLISQEVVRFVQIERAAETAGQFLARFDFLRRNADSRAQRVGSAPGAFGCILSAQMRPFSLL